MPACAALSRVGERTLQSSAPRGTAGTLLDATSHGVRRVLLPPAAAQAARVVTVVWALRPRGPLPWFWVWLVATLLPEALESCGNS